MFQILFCPLARKDPKEVIANMISDLPEEYEGLSMKEMLSHSNMNRVKLTQLRQYLNNNGRCQNSLMKNEEQAHHGRFLAQAWW